MRNDRLDWEKVLSVDLDNTNTIMGEHNSLKSRTHTENLETFIAGYNSHLAHIAACNGGQGYCPATGFDCKEHQIDLFYFFKNSTGRKGILVESLEFVGFEQENVTRFVSTRCLSPETCCEFVYEPIRERLKM